MAVVTYNATGRRKSSVARVRLVPGEGNIVINDRELNKYFGLKTLELIVNQPLEVTETKGKYDVLVNVNGGGISGQAGAIRHGIARALLKVDAEFRPALKKAGFLTRDPREKERRKYGLKKARKASQFGELASFTSFGLLSSTNHKYKSHKLLRSCFGCGVFVLSVSLVFCL